MSQSVYLVIGEYTDRQPYWVIAQFTEEEHAILLVNEIYKEVKSHKIGEVYKNRYDPRQPAYYGSMEYEFSVLEVPLYAHYDQFLEEHNI